MPLEGVRHMSAECINSEIDLTFKRLMMSIDGRHNSLCILCKFRGCLIRSGSQLDFDSIVTEVHGRDINLENLPAVHGASKPLVEYSVLICDGLTQHDVVDKRLKN